MLGTICSRRTSDASSILEIRNAKCGVRNQIYEKRNAECEIRNAKCGMRSAECETGVLLMEKHYGVSPASYYRSCANLTWTILAKVRVIALKRSYVLFSSSPPQGRLDSLLSRSLKL